jgi:hypothetical protein
MHGGGWKPQGVWNTDQEHSARNRWKESARNAGRPGTQDHELEAGNTGSGTSFLKKTRFSDFLVSSRGDIFLGVWMPSS